MNVECRLRMPKKRPEVFAYLCVFILICFRCYFFLSSLWYAVLLFFGQNWNTSGFLRETEIALSACWGGEEAALYLKCVL